MRKNRFLLSASHNHRYKRYKRSFSSVFTFVGFITFLCTMIFYTVTGIIEIAVLAVSVLSKLIKRIIDYKHYKDIGMNSLKLQQDIKRMSPRQFEVFCNELLNANGYDSEVTQASQDGGKDCVAFKDGNKFFVEVKHWNGEIGRVLLQKLIGACIGDSANKAIFITTSWYNSNAVEYAEKIDWLELWDMNDILQILYNTDVKKVPWIMSKSMEYTEEDVLDSVKGFGDKVENFNKNMDKQFR